MSTAPRVTTESFEMMHGVPIYDPYRWLEDRSSPETESWIADQRTCFEEYFLRLGPLQRLQKRVSDLLDIETVEQVGRVHDRYFYCKRLAGDEQASIFVRTSESDSERLLVSSTGQGPYASIRIHRVSATGGFLAYELKQGGEHRKAIHIVDVASGIALEDHLNSGLARGLVLRDKDDGFYYCHECLDDEEKDHIILFHRLGTPNTEDVALLTMPRTRASKVLLIYEGDMLGAIHCHQQVDRPVVDFYVSRQDHDDDWMLVCQNEPAPFSPFFYHGGLFVFRFEQTPNGEIAELDAATGQFIRTVVPEWDVCSRQCSIVSGLLYISYRIGSDTVVRIWSFDGRFMGTLPLEAGNTWGLVPGFSNDVDELILHQESFTKPPTLLRFNPRTGERAVWHQRAMPPLASSYITRQVTYQSGDGTEIGMSLVGPEEDELLRDRPVIMTGYGGFGITMTPQFSTFIAILLELGFLFALPQIRGGGERGAAWHEAARGRRRQVAFDDFIASAEWLCDNSFTKPGKLGIFGGSNSGLLVGAAITQRPDLFRAAVCIAPLLDMVRYHLFDRARTWASEYGTAEDPDDFRAILAYSPYHHIRDDTNYPAVLFVCGDRDTRCNPAHARKMTALLRGRLAQKHPILVDHSLERGHSPTMPLSVRVAALTHRIAFLCNELGVPFLPENLDDATSR